MVLLPWCEDNGANAKSTECAEVHELFSMDALNLLIPTKSWPIGDGRPLCTDLIRDVTNISADFSDVLPSSLCYHPPWMHRVDDNCAHNLSFALQVNFTNFLKVYKFWVPAARIMTAVDKIIAEIQGPYMSVHIRRSQHWLPGEMRGWGTTWPDVTLSMEKIIEVLNYTNYVHPLVNRNIFLATNSQNLTELSVLKSFCRQHNCRLFTADTIGNSTHIERIAIDLALLCRGSIFVGTPGSTFTANVRHYHLTHYGNDDKIRTLCQYRREMEKNNILSHL